jgi:hydroxymethylpyrimidine pyrophosphatase-like HAD family hydrolase
MGRRYDLEIERLPELLQWASELNTDDLTRFISNSYGTNLITVGSGGTFAAAKFAALLHEEFGSMAKAITPLDAVDYRFPIRNTSAILLSASGQNRDIRTSFEYLAKLEPEQLIAVCLKSLSPLNGISNKYKYSSVLNFEKPHGKDGFLATNSLVAFMMILLKAYNKFSDGALYKSVQPILPNIKRIRKEQRKAALKLSGVNTWIVLHGHWGAVAADDLESRFSEAGLKSIQKVDFRNFAHGRHYWFSRNLGSTGVIALETLQDSELSRKTISLLPEAVPMVRFIGRNNGPLGSMELTIQSIILAEQLGLVIGVDPGRPHVPEYGRRIFHLSIPNSMRKENGTLKQEKYIAVRRKGGAKLSILEKAYVKFISNITSQKFGGLILDFDGTILDFEDRLQSPKPEISLFLNAILEKNIQLGVASGRGKSLQVAMRKVIRKQYWPLVTLGYYNGAYIDLLSSKFDTRRTSSHQSNQDSISKLYKIIKRLKRFESSISASQISIRFDSKHDRTLFSDNILGWANKFPDLEVLESAHSFDVIKKGVSKQLLVKQVKQKVIEVDGQYSVLCMGDKGQWPGNDFLLLNEPFSLSVDEVSTDLDSCWNLSPAGQRGVQAAISYFHRISIYRNYFKFE